MHKNPLVWIGLFVGSAIGQFLPVLWGDSGLFSMSSVILTAVGGILGIWVGFKISQNL